MTDKELLIICFQIALSFIVWVIYWLVVIFVMVILLAGVVSKLGYLRKRR